MRNASDVNRWEDDTTMKMVKNFLRGNAASVTADILPKDYGLAETFLKAIQDRLEEPSGS